MLRRLSSPASCAVSMTTNWVQLVNVRIWIDEGYRLHSASNSCLGKILRICDSTVLECAMVGTSSFFMDFLQIKYTTHMHSSPYFLTKSLVNYETAVGRAPLFKTFLQGVCDEKTLYVFCVK